MQTSYSDLQRKLLNYVYIPNFTALISALDFAGRHLFLILSKSQATGNPDSLREDRHCTCLIGQADASVLDGVVIRSHEFYGNISGSCHFHSLIWTSFPSLSIL